MKKLTTLFITAAVMAALAGCCAKGKTEAAPLPDKSTILKEILNERKSIRKFAEDKPVTDNVMLDILWAANGINREDGRRTAPSAVNAQDIVMYVCKSEGTYLYHPQTEELDQISGTDIRPIIASFNKFALTNPVILLCSDYTKFARFSPEAAAKYGAMDAGYVSQNIYIYCAANNMATVACAPSMDNAAVQKALMLPETMVPLIYHPVGYPAE